jgi:hypothetical protein
LNQQPDSITRYGVAKTGSTITINARSKKLLTPDSIIILLPLTFTLEL